MDDLRRALEKATLSDSVPARVKGEASGLLAYMDSYMRQGHGAMRQPKTKVVEVVAEEKPKAKDKK